MLLYLVLALLLLSLAGGAWGQSRYGYVGWSPAGILLVVVVILYLTGNLHLR